MSRDPINIQIWKQALVGDNEAVAERVAAEFAAAEAGQQAELVVPTASSSQVGGGSMPLVPMLTCCPVLKAIKAHRLPPLLKVSNKSRGISGARLNQGEGRHRTATDEEANTRHLALMSRVTS